MGDYAAVVSTRFPGCRLERSWPLAGGVSATTVGLEVAHKDGRVERLVLRQLSTADFKGEAPLASIAEHALVCRLHALDLPVPRPRLADVSRTLLAQPYVVYDFVEGCTAGRHRRPWRRRWLICCAACIESTTKDSLTRCPGETRRCQTSTSSSR